MYDAVVSTAAQIDVDLCVVDEIDDPSAMGIVARTQQVIVFTSAARAKSAMPNGLVAIPIVDPIPLLAMYAAWRTSADTHVVDAFLASLDKARPHRWQGPTDAGGESEPRNSMFAPRRWNPGG